MVRYWMSLWLGVLGAIVFPMGEVLAQSVIVPDGTLGNERSRLGTVIVNGQPSPIIDSIIGGARRGQNLFHSFQDFNIAAERGVYFQNPDAAVQNILARVTGNKNSTIEGTLGTFGPGRPNLFLINPNGIMFGKNASLDVQASFTATTASAIGFGNTGEFSAINPQQPGALLTVDPSAFIFASLQKPGSIVVQSQATRSVLENTTFGLQVPNGQALLLLGGDVKIEGGQLSARGGQIVLGAVDSIGTVVRNGPGSLRFTSELARGTVALTAGSQINVVFDNGGEINITARDIEIVGSRLVAGIRSDLGTVMSRSGNIQLSATGIVRVEEFSRISNNINLRAIGTGGNLQIAANSLLLTNGSLMTTTTFGTGDAGNIVITTQSIKVDRGINYSLTGIFNNVGITGMGKGGVTAIQTNELVFLNGGQFTSATFGKGDAGKTSIRSKSIRIDGGINNLRSGIFTTSEPSAKGKGGSINIQTDMLIFTDGGQLAAATFGKGDAGNVTVRARVVSIDGGSRNFRSGIFNSVENSGIGKGGLIDVTTDILSFTNGGQFASATFGQGDAGSIKIDAKVISINGFEEDFNSGIFVLSKTSSNAGDIVLTTPILQLDRQGTISGISSTVDGGNITLNIGKLLTLRNGSQITATAGTDNAGGNGGNIILNSPNGFLVAIPNENSDITANAFNGSGGRVTITNQGIFGLQFRPQLTDLSDITASSQFGLSGTVLINSPDTSFIQNGLNQLPKETIDTTKLLSQTCIVRKDKPNGTFYITGTGGLPNRPSDPSLSNYPTNTIAPTQTVTRPWQKGDPIVEPQGFYTLTNGRLIMSRECAK